MGIQVMPSLPHWNYFITLEDDLLQVSRYVDFSGNQNTYSLELGRLLMAAAAEVDVVMKQLVRRWKPTSRASSIGGYQPVVAEKISGLRSFGVTVPRFGLSMKPWSSWTATKPPRWWTAANKVKHHRHTHFKEATLKNCLNSMAGLFSAVAFFYAEEAQAGVLVPAARLLHAHESHSLGQFVDRYGVVPMISVPAPT